MSDSRRGVRRITVKYLPLPKFYYPDLRSQRHATRIRGAGKCGLGKRGLGRCGVRGLGMRSPGLRLNFAGSSSSFDRTLFTSFMA